MKITLVSIFSCAHQRAVVVSACMLWLLISLSLFPASAAMAQSLSANQVIERAQAELRAKTEQGSLTMTVHTPEWQRTLSMHYWSVTPDKTFIRVVAPSRDAGTSTLRLGSNMWNYLPSVERTIKIPPSLMLQSWMGSDFTNDDLVRESSLVKDYFHKFSGEATIDGDRCYRIVATPKPNAPVVWGHLVLYVRKKDDLPRREEYYGDNGKLKKVLTYEDIRMVDGRLYPMRWKMVSVTKRGHYTLLIYTKLKFNRRIPSYIFTRGNLEQPF